MRIKRQDALMDARRKALAATAEEGSDTVATEREDDQLQSHAEVSSPGSSFRLHLSADFVLPIE